MANRFPLIANSSDSKIYELPSGDNLDLTGSGIYNGTATITLPTATSTLATLAGTETLTNKTVNLSSNTLTGTIAQFNTALSDADFATLAGTETLTNKTINLSSNTLTGTIAQFNTALSDADFATLAGTETLTNKTLTTPTIGGGGANLSGATSGSLNLRAAATAGTGVIVTIPATTGTIVTTGDSGTVTSTMIADGTIVNADINASAAIAVSKLAASTISGVTLGNNLNALTIGTGLSGTSYNGSSAVTIAIDSTVATLTGTQTLTNKTINLTNNTLVATSAQIAAAVTDETGSGSLVFSASPTFTGTANFAAISTSGNTDVGGNLTVTGNLTVNGTTTTINSTAVSVDDINIILGDTASPSNATADGGGITLKGTTDKTLNWVNATAAWTSSEDFNLLTGKVYEINGTTVLSATALGTGVVSSSLTSVGTIGTGTWQGTVIGSTYGGTGVNNGGRTITLNTGNLTLTAQAAGSSVTVPASGTLISSADTGTVTSTMIADGTIVNADINASAAIALTKLASDTTTSLGVGTIELGHASDTTLARSAAGVVTVEGVEIVTLSRSQTLTNKTLTLPTIGGTGAVFNGSTSGTTTLLASATAGTTTITLPATTGTVVTTGDTGTVTNTMLAGSIANAKLANSTISGIALGSNLATLTIGTGLSGTSYNGGTAVTIANTGVTSIVAGTGITISGATGAVTINSSVPNASTQVSSLGIGTAASGTTGEIRATNAITSYYSDERLKKDITEIDGALDKVMQLKGVTFRANDLAESFGYSSDKEQVGVIAQDVEKVLPQIVVPAPFDRIQIQEGVEISRSGENYKTVHYEKIVPLLIQAIKEQQVMIEELKKKVGI